MASRVTDGWLAKLRGENLPLAVALQGVAVFVLGFLLTGSPTQHEAEGGAANWSLDESSPPLVSDSYVPADLKPEQVRLPRFPDPRERQKRLPAPSKRQGEEAPAAAQVLDALRVDSVAIQVPTPAQVALGPPDGPDRLVAGALSLRRFGEGSGNSGRSGRGGWGTGGIGGGGLGEGPSCHPRRGGILSAGFDPRNPGGDLPLIIERAPTYPR